jgi:hypothetical protein
MKNLKKQSPILLLSFLFMMESCSKSYTAPNPPANTNPSSTVVSGTWIISSFTQATEDKTSLFDGYVFTFDSVGNIKAEKNGAVATGTWSYTPSSVGYYGSTPSKSSFTINVGASVPLGSLTKTWNIDSTNTSSSKLALISPEVVENMHVNFSKL